MKKNHLTIGELARLAGVSHRQLRHYEAMGLLPQTERTERGYRLFGPEAVAVVSEVLALRRMGLGLKEIALALEVPGKRRARLEAALTRIEAEAAELAAQITKLRAALAAPEKEGEMDEVYKPHSNAKQRAYEVELIRTGPPGMAGEIALSKAYAKSNPGAIAQAMAALPAIEGALVAAFKAGRAPEVAEVEAHRSWVARMWGKDCAPEAYAGLADLYEASPDFRARYEAMAPGFGPWLSAAMRDHAGRLSHSPRRMP